MELGEDEEECVRDHLKNNRQYIYSTDGKGNIKRKTIRNGNWKVMELHEIHALANSIFTNKIEKIEKSDTPSDSSCDMYDVLAYLIKFFNLTIKEVAGYLEARSKYETDRRRIRRAEKKRELEAASSSQSPTNPSRVVESSASALDLATSVARKEGLLAGYAPITPYKPIELKGIGSNIALNKETATSPQPPAKRRRAGPFASNLDATTSAARTTRNPVQELIKPIIENHLKTSSRFSYKSDKKGNLNRVSKGTGREEQMEIHEILSLANTILSKKVKKQNNVPHKVTIDDILVYLITRFNLTEKNPIEYSRAHLKYKNYKCDQKKSRQRGSVAGPSASNLDATTSAARASTNPRQGAISPNEIRGNYNPDRNRPITVAEIAGIEPNNATNVENKLEKLSRQLGL